MKLKCVFVPLSGRKGKINPKMLTRLRPFFLTGFVFVLFFAFLFAKQVLFDFGFGENSSRENGLFYTGWVESPGQNSEAENFKTLGALFDASAGIESLFGQTQGVLNDEAEESGNMDLECNNAVMAGEREERPGGQEKETYSVLIIGDSFMAPNGAVGDAIKQRLSQCGNIELSRFGKSSSGLSAEDFFDWKKKAEELISCQDFDFALIMLGSNDARPLTASDGSIECSFGSASWQEEYSKRVSEFVKIFLEKGITVFWIGAPPMRDNMLNEHLFEMNLIYQATAEANDNAYFIPIWDLFSDDQGGFADFVENKNGDYVLARKPDGVHMHYEGGLIAADEAMKVLSKVFSSKIGN